MSKKRQYPKSESPPAVINISCGICKKKRNLGHLWECEICHDKYCMGDCKLEITTFHCLNCNLEICEFCVDDGHCKGHSLE